MAEPIPYAQFRFNGETVSLNEPDFYVAVRNGTLCQCGDCLNCRAAQYADDNTIPVFSIHRKKDDT